MATHTQFAPVLLDSIEQGKYVERCYKSFDELQHALVSFVEKNDCNASTTLTMKITVKYDKANKAYFIVTDIDKKPPKQPAGVTTAFVAQDPDGKQGLWSQRYGTTDGDPKQQLLCNEEGDVE